MSNQESVRFTVNISVAQRDKLNQIIDDYKVTQPEAISVLVDYLIDNEGKFTETFKRIREEKLALRGKRKSDELLNKFKSLTPEQLAALEALN
jgi:hypothetical protein